MVEKTDSQLSSHVSDDSKVERLESSENNAESSDSEISAVLSLSEGQSRSTPTSGPPQSKRKSPCAQVISL